MVKKSKKRGVSSTETEITVKKLKKMNEADDDVTAPHDSVEPHIESQEMQELFENEVEPQKYIEEEKITFSKDFKISQFRKKLKGNNFIPELRQFIHLAKTKPKIISKYIENKGKPLELAEALERIDKSHLFHISYICEALQLVLMEILSNEKQHITSAINVSRYFLKSHSHVIEKLLKSPNIEHRKCIIKLLTAIVCLEPQLGRQILTTFDVISNTKSMEELLSHSKAEIGQVESVRKCFIHFFLSYLIDGNPLLIRNILDKYNLMNSLLSGLIYDDHITVCVVLNTLKKYVLETLDISKTKKVHVFDLINIKHLIRLYDWKGPNVYAILVDHKKKNPTSNERELIDSDEKDAVVKTAHEFLCLLLSSRKYGIAFDTTVNLRQRKNVLQGKILASLESPWLCNLKTDLMIKILKACPELASRTVKNYALYLSRNRTPSASNWQKVAHFMEKIISELHPHIMRRALEKITLTEYTYWIKEICLCPEALINLKGAHALRSEIFENRFATTKLFLAMFKQFCNYMNAILEREKVKGNDLKKFKFDILNHIFVNFPPVQNILLAFYESIKSASSYSSNKENTIDVLDHIEITLDLVLLIAKNCRSFIDATGVIVDYIEILRPFYESFTQDDEERRVRIELKVVKAILLLLPQSLKPNTKHFEHVLQSFINAFILGKGSNQKEAGNLLQGILMNLKSMKNSILEIDIWLEALKFISPQCQNIINDILPKIFRMKFNSFNNINNDTENGNCDFSKTTDIVKLFENIENNMSIQGVFERLILSDLLFMFNEFLHNFKPEMITWHLEEGELDEMRKKSQKIVEYLDIVSLLLFHYLPSSGMIQKNYSRNYHKYNEYMLNSLDKLQSTKFICENIPKYSEIYKSILASEQNFHKLFVLPKDHPNAIVIVIDEKDAHFDKSLESERLILIYIYEIIFIVSQLIQKSNFDGNISNSCVHYLQNFLKILFYYHTQEKQNDQKIEKPDNNEQEQLTYLENILKYIFCNHFTLLQHFTLFGRTKSEQIFTDFICSLMKCVNQFNLNNIHIFSVHYRSKIVNQLITNINSTLQKGNLNSLSTDDNARILNTIEIFQLSEENSMEILKSLSKLSSENFYINNSTRSLYLDILIYTINRLSELKTLQINENYIVNVFEIYKNLLQNSNIDINLEKFEDSLYNFIAIHFQLIAKLPQEIFLATLESRKITKSSIKLSTIFLERRNDFNEVFLQQLPEYISKKELIYPLLSVIIGKRVPIDKKLLNTIYQEYKNGFLKTIEKPQKAGVIYKENVSVSLYLIENCMPESECFDFCKKSLKTDAIEIYQLKVIERIYRKAMEVATTSTTGHDNSGNDKELILVNFFNTVIQLFLIAMRKEYSDRIKIELLSFMVYDWSRLWQLLNANHSIPYNFDKILNSQHWQHFYKNCLKSGMQGIEIDGQRSEQCNDQNNSNYLKILAFFCDIFYRNQRDHSDVQRIFEMICSHSRFFDIVLSQKSSHVKTEIIHILFNLIRQNIELLESKYIPILLGAYQCKLSPCDRYILAILQFYEQNGGSLYEFRPFIWSELAISHYGLNERKDEDLASLNIVNLEQQEPSILQVMSLIDRRISDYTLTNFPIWRKLNTLKQLPVVEFNDPTAINVVSCGRNRLEIDIESGKTEFDESFLRLCCKRDEIYEDCYDPAFIIPLMSMAFAPEMYSQPVRPVQNGLLAIAFAALSSQDKDMRLAAGCVQVRYRQHFENSKFYDKPLWVQTYDSVQNGLNSLRKDWRKHKKIDVPRVPYISGLFLAKSINTLIDPMNPLYRVITMYLRLKNTFNFLCVPEFNILFHSSEIDHQIYRIYILEIIRDGIKCSSDLFLLVSTNIFKVILGFYGSTASNLDVNLLILNIIAICCKIPASSKILIEHIGIIPWLNSVINSTEYYHFDTIEAIISVINNLWYSMKAKQKDFYNFNHIQGKIYNLLIRLSTIISGRISLNNFVRFLNILSKTVVQSRNYRAISEENLDKLIGCMQRHCEEHVFYINNIKLNGTESIESVHMYCKKLKNSELDDLSILGLLSLRNFIVGWIENK